MYNVILWKDNGNEDFHVFEKKPTFKELYRLMSCTMIEIVQGYNQDVSNRTFDMYIDEEGKFNSMKYPNKRATAAWYTWQSRTGHQSLPGDNIVGDVAIIRKVSNGHKNTSKNMQSNR